MTKMSQGAKGKGSDITGGQERIGTEKLKSPKEARKRR